jgi:hemerythrin
MQPGELKGEYMLLHDQAVKNLDPKDYLLIEKEHAQLEQFLADLATACACAQIDKPSLHSNCSPENQASCQGRLPSYLYYVCDLAAKHFDHEEDIMLSRPHVTEDYAYFRLHRLAHIDILQNINDLVDQCVALGKLDHTAEIYRKFHHELSEIFAAHDRAFDDPFIASTQAQG